MCAGLEGGGGHSEGGLGGEPDDPPPAEEGIDDPELVGDGIWQPLIAMANTAARTILCSGTFRPKFRVKLDTFSALPLTRVLINGLRIVSLFSQRVVDSRRGN